MRPAITTELNGELVAVDVAASVEAADVNFTTVSVTARVLYGRFFHKIAEFTGFGQRLLMINSAIDAPSC